ncbi:MAG: lipid-A-disaccharide synthase [Alphaproteobacteria bacterium]
MSKPDPTSSLKLAVLAGEPSGDLLGAEIVAALHQRLGPEGVELVGVGGEHLSAKGLNSLYPMETLSIMGIAEVLPRLRELLKIIRGSAREIAAAQPDIVLSIDSPDFGFRVQKKLAKALPNTPRVHMVAPTVWAWRAGRAKKVSRFLTHMLTLLPFEPPYFTAHGLTSHFVGHPALNRIPPQEKGSFRAAHNIAQEAPLLVVLPGSRMSEVSRLLEPFGQVLAQVAAGLPALRIVVPTVPNVEAAVRTGVANWPGDPIVVMGDEARFAAFTDANAALAASGTVSLELTIANVPTVIAYKTAALTAFVVRRMVKVDYASLTNLLVAREVIPEFIQQDAKPDAIAAALLPLLQDDAAQAKQRAGFAEALAALGKGQGNPAERAADILIDIWKEQTHEQ